MVLGQGQREQSHDGGEPDHGEEADPIPGAALRGRQRERAHQRGWQEAKPGQQAVAHLADVVLEGPLGLGLLADGQPSQLLGAVELVPEGAAEARQHATGARREDADRHGEAAGQRHVRQQPPLAAGQQVDQDDQPRLQGADQPLGQPGDPHHHEEGVEVDLVLGPRLAEHIQKEQQRERVDRHTDGRAQRLPAQLDPQRDPNKRAGDGVELQGHEGAEGQQEEIRRDVVRPAHVPGAELEALDRDLVAVAEYRHHEQSDPSRDQPDIGHVGHGLPRDHEVHRGGGHHHRG